MSFGDKLNNPGDLTVGNSKIGRIGSGMLYPGQSGYVNGPTLSDGSHFIFAQFPDAATGSAGLVDYVKRHIAKGWNTVSTFVFGFLGTSSDNAANPHVQSYLKAVEHSTGLGPNDHITAANADAIAAGISRAEGSKSYMTTAQTNLGGAVGSLAHDFTTGLGSVITNPFGSGQILGQTVLDGSGLVLTDPGKGLDILTSGFQAGATTTAQAAADTSAQAITQAGSAISGALGDFNTFLGSIFNGNNLERAVLVVVGILLLAAALFALSKNYVPPAAAAALA
jgi:hypothetical protein